MPPHATRLATREFSRVQRPIVLFRSYQLSLAFLSTAAATVLYYRNYCARVNKYGVRTINTNTATALLSAAWLFSVLANAPKRRAGVTG